MKPSDTGGANTQQLRDAIDRGKTGSKVAFPDPAASPLGTDDEAGGARNDPGTVGATLRRETQNRQNTDAPSPDTRQAPSDAMYYGQAQQKRGNRLVTALVTAGVLVVAYLLFVVLR